MKQMLQSVTQTVKALPVMQERAKMPSARVKTQVRSVLFAFLCLAMSAALFALTPAPWYVGTAFAALGVFALDARMVKDFAVGIGQLVRAVRGEEAPRGS